MASATAGPALDTQASAEVEDIRESLTCGICSDILHDCVSIQPCLHSFCGGCASEWIRRSAVCPTCRCKVEALAVNHRLNDVVDTYLKHHPDERRADDELAVLDSRNDVKKQGGVLKLQPAPATTDSTDVGPSSSSGCDSTSGLGWMAGAAAVGAIAGGLLVHFLSKSSTKSGQDSDSDG